MTKQFGAKSTTDDVLEGIDLSGKRALVTGVSAGLGVETARTLKAHGAEVVGTARDLAKAERALQEAGAWPIELVEVDLANLRSVRAGADNDPSARVVVERPDEALLAGQQSFESGERDWRRDVEGPSVGQRLVRYAMVY